MWLQFYRDLKIVAQSEAVYFKVYFQLSVIGNFFQDFCTFILHLTLSFLYVVK